MFSARYLSRVIYLECVLLLFIIYRSVHLTCVISSRNTQCRRQPAAGISPGIMSPEFPAAEISTYDGRKLPPCLSFYLSLSFSFSCFSSHCARGTYRKLSYVPASFVIEIVERSSTPRGGNKKKIFRQITHEAGMQ